MTPEQLYRQHSPQMLAYLYSLTGDLDNAQEIWHDTFIEALEHWQPKPPVNPAAWFKRTAKNKFIDRFRHQKMTMEKSALIKALASESDTHQVSATDFGDEQLKLIFTCCHPALEFDKQVALTLNTVAGLTTEQVADALLLGKTTLEQRLTRAKRKIKQASIPFTIPEQKQLSDRLNAVLKTLYLMFNTGVNHPADPFDLAGNALSLLQRLNQLLPEQAEVEGMTALMMFHQSRHSARFTPQGKLIKLSEQDRNLWHKPLILEADSLLQKALKRQHIGVYQLQAAIQGLHCDAPYYADTDWQQIEALYRVHMQIDGSPVVKLNAIFAMSMSRSVEFALAELTQLEDTGALKHYAPFYATAAELYERSGQLTRARQYADTAASLSTTAHEKHYLQAYATSLTSQLGASAQVLG